MKLASVLAAIAIAAQAAHATNAVNTTNAVPDVAVDAPSDGEPELSYPDEDCPNPKKVPHCCAHVRFRNKVARAHNCHAIVKQPGSLEGVGTACARTSGWMALCCKPNPRRKRFTCEAPRRGFWSGSPQYPDRGVSLPSQEDWPAEAETGASFQDEPSRWREGNGRPMTMAPRPGSREGYRGWADNGEWPAESKTGPSYSDGPREWADGEEYRPRKNSARPGFRDESVSWTEAEEYLRRESGDGAGSRNGNRWTEDGYRPRERARFRDGSSSWTDAKPEPQEYRSRKSEAGSGFRDWPRWTEEEYQPRKYKSKPASRGGRRGSAGRGRGRSRKTGSWRGSRGGRRNTDEDRWE